MALSLKAWAVGVPLVACTPDAAERVWDVETPPRFVFDDSRPPHVAVPGDATAQDAVDVPFAQDGTDDREEGLVYTSALAGYYLMRIQDSELGYHYQYDPVVGTFEEVDNVHRKSGATFTQVWLYRFTRRPEFRMSTRAALGYLLGQTRVLDDGTRRLRNLGGTSLILLSLTEYSELAETDEYDREIDELGAHLLALIGPDGAFTAGDALQQAQAHQALWRLWAYRGDERYLDALAELARYVYDHRSDKRVYDAPYIYGLWANEPLTELYGLRSEPWIAELVLEVGDDVIQEQHTPLDVVDPEWVGGYWPGTRPGEPGWNSTLKLEAVIDAYRMAEQVGDEARMAAFRRSALIGAAFLQRLQYRAGETGSFADPDFAVGGTPFSPSDTRVRLDVPHHMANALLKVVQYLDLEDYPGRE